MLTFAEEILLLALDDHKGTIKPLPVMAMKFALTGAILMELAIADRIDTDLQTLKVINPAPMGQPLVDDMLRKLAAKPGEQDTESWLRELALQNDDLQDRVLEQLVEKGVLKVENHKILWVFAVRRYPLIDNREVKEVRARLRDLIASDEIPDPREAVLVSLVNACQLFGEIFPEAWELQRMRPRIEALSKLDLIGREVNSYINSISLAVASGMATIM